MSPEVLKFLQELVMSQNISISNPNLVELANLVQKVKIELETEIETTGKPA